MNLLFLGASNTDCGHCFTADNLGNGYVKMTCDYLGVAPSQAINGGTDGFTFPRIYRKWEANWFGRPFDTVIILGGINEVGALMDSGCGASARQELIRQSALALHSLLEGLRESGCFSVFVLEPFLFDTPAFLQNWQGCLADLRQMIQTVLAGHPDVHFLPVQQLLTQAAADLGVNAVTTDGIHLSETGHRYLAKYLAEQIAAARHSVFS